MTNMTAIAASVEELLATADRREEFEPTQRRSAVRFERVWIDGEPHVVKYLHAEHDFMMRALGIDGSVILRALEAGLFDTAPDAIDHAVVGAAAGVGADAAGCAVLMRDVSEYLVSPGDDVFPEEQHHYFIDHLARMCASTWGWHDTIGLAPYDRRWSFCSHDFVDAERRRGDMERVAALITPGWDQFAARAPRAVARGVDALRRDVHPLTSALQATPSCFLHGDWKASNLGTAPDGRTILLDWVYLGEGPASHDLAWYLALNRQKLPASKEQVIAEFRQALARHGVDTAGWFERQVGLALLGAVVEFGWEKALGDDDELGWWCERADEGLSLL